MGSSTRILKIYPESFRANVYSTNPFRMIGLIDASIKYPYGIERVTLAFFRSSGTNLGKIKGLWYPIIGIKTHTGNFTEFTEYINYVLAHTAKNGQAKKDWLAKSIFFANQAKKNPKVRGFSNGKHSKNLHKIGNILSELYENKKYVKMRSLNATKLNSILTSQEIYQYNRHTQRNNFELFIKDIYREI